MTTQEAPQTFGNVSVEASAPALLLQRAMEAVDDQMLAITQKSEVELLRDTSRHILEAGGKRIRPRMLFLTYLACGGRDIDITVPVAAAVELVHTASVVHDDINDHGVVRRGRPSINAIWGRTFALLTGDFLFTKVYELMSPYKDLNMVLADATVALVEGETLQAEAVKNKTFTREVYTRIIALKTAALFKAAAMLGALLANADDEVVQAMGNFGYATGMAFQIVDDILDLTADESQLGKTAGIDLTQGKGLAAALNGEEAPESSPMDDIKRKAFDGDTIEKGIQQAEQFVQIALNSLEDLPESDEKEALAKLAWSVIKRDH
ncbi:MAG: polyprenyl synthetase family protein [Chloroflexi bacterium]|nr:MAG: polyprenyl synthetase family protein [Chloroflexota bacterium]